MSGGQTRERSKGSNWSNSCAGCRRKGLWIILRRFYPMLFLWRVFSHGKNGNGVQNEWLGLCDLGWDLTDARRVWPGVQIAFSDKPPLSPVESFSVQFSTLTYQVRPLNICPFTDVNKRRYLQMYLILNITKVGTYQSMYQVL